MPRTGIALSGGGHRACLWALGVLLYLTDAGRNGRVTSIASVSGGSLANGAIGQRLDYTTATPAEVRTAVGSLAQQIAGRGTVFSWWGTYVYLLLLVVGGAAAAMVPWRLGLDAWLAALVFAAAILAWSWLLMLRRAVTARAFEHAILRAPGRPPTLDGLHTALDHIICATDLHAGEHVYFSGSWVCSYRFGLGGTGDLPLRRAVQASAAYPGVFPVTWVRTKRFGFRRASEHAAGSAKAMALTDGGVYDNMGDQWMHGLDNRLKRWPEAPFRPADELIVANSSPGLAWGSVWALRVPILGELLALLRDISVLYDNGTSVRRRELVARFDLAARTGSGLRGALVHIPQSPFTVPDHFAGEETAWPERSARAKAVVEKLRGDDEEATRRAWRQTAKDNAAVKTTLVAFSPEVCARLLYHAYVLAMINLHVILDFPMLGIPEAKRFADIVAGTCGKKA